MNKKVIYTQLLPKGQKAIIKKSLEVYRTSLKGLDNENDEVTNVLFDIVSLQSLLDYDVAVTLPLDSIDIPSYEHVEPLYPIDIITPESERTAVMFGNFVDHKKRLEVISINRIEMVLRSELDDVCEDGLDTSEGYLVLEEYDGVIDINNFNETYEEVPIQEPKSRYQVVWLATEFEPTTKVVEFSDFTNPANGWDCEIVETVSGLSIKETYNHSDEIMVIRLSDK